MDGICENFSAVTIEKNKSSDTMDPKVCKYNGLTADELLSLCIDPDELRNIFEYLTNINLCTPGTVFHI